MGDALETWRERYEGYRLLSGLPNFGDTFDIDGLFDVLISLSTAVFWDPALSSAEHRTVAAALRQPFSCGGCTVSDPPVRACSRRAAFAGTRGR